MAAKLAILIELSVIAQEPIYGFRHGPLSGSDRLIPRSPAPLIESSNQRHEPAIGNIAAPCPERLPDPFAVVEPVNVKRALALVRPDFAAARSEKLAPLQVPSEWVKLVISIHVSTLPRPSVAGSGPHRSASYRPSPRRSAKS